MSTLLVFWRSTVGKKAVMSATGLIMILFLISFISPRIC
jgi:hypothetical protein